MNPWIYIRKSGGGGLFSEFLRCIKKQSRMHSPPSHHPRNSAQEKKAALFLTA